MIKWTRPSSSVFAYSKQSKTGRWAGLGTRLISLLAKKNTYTYPGKHKRGVLAVGTPYSQLAWSHCPTGFLAVDIESGVGGCSGCVCTRACVWEVQQLFEDMLCKQATRVVREHLTIQPISLFISCNCFVVPLPYRRTSPSH